MAPSMPGTRVLLSSGPVRRSVLGALAGLLGSLVLAPALRVGPGAVPLAIASGVAFAAWFRFSRGHRLDAMMTGAALGIPAWALVDVVVLPALSGGPPLWSAPGMRTLVPELVGWVLFGSVLGLASQLFLDAATRWLGPETRRMPPPAPPKRQVVVLGGGFAGVTVAAELERLFGADRSVAFTLVSDTNALLFTPMLAEVAGSSLEPTHISSPIRTTLHRTRVVRGSVTKIDLEARTVVVACDPPVTLGWDQIVLALGSVTNHLGLDGVARHTLGFKTLREAIRIRNEVIDAFERAEVEADPDRRRELLTFVVAGGGFAGVELAGALNDFARGMLADYPSLRPAEVSVVLVHSGERILPELSPRLAAYAQERMAARGVTFLLGARVSGARRGAFTLQSGDLVHGRTLVWTAGASPHPILASLDLERSKRGAVVVDAFLRVPGKAGAWAAGDCAAVLDARSRKPCPPTAQFALREARAVARNVHATLTGGTLRPFHFEALGALCVVGHHTACAELRLPFTGRFVRFSGLLAWLMWRAIYLSKLPGFERKVRVLSDWTLELFFPRDIVQTIDLLEPRRDP